MRSATSSWTNNKRSAEQRWPAERNAEVTTSSATCSGSAVASTIVDGARDLGRSGEDDAGDIRLRHQRSTNPSVAGHQTQRRVRQACLLQQANGRGCDPRRLFGGLGNHRVAGHQRRSDLAEEDRQRKIPRRYRDEHAATAQLQHIALAGRARHRFARTEQIAAFRRIIAAEIDRLADFRKRVIERLAALALQ